MAYPSTITSDHFQIHYTGDQNAVDGVIDQTAADVAATAERAYTAITQTYGFPPPLDDGDGKTDIWIGSTGSADVLGLAVPDNPAASQSSGYIVLDSVDGLSDHVVAHELFHLVQFGIWLPADGWLLESTAEWTGFRFEDFGAPNLLSSLGAPDMSLDCIGDKCGNDDYERGGYSRWSFFEYLSERFGNTIVKDVLDRGAALGDPAVPAIALVSDALAAKGTTLANAFTDWTVANLSGNYTATGLYGFLPPAYTEVVTGGSTATMPTQQIAVNHLAARYIAFMRGDGTDGACYAAKLTVNVTLPAGIDAHPYFYWPAVDAAAVPLTVGAGTATVTVPWDTCAWPYDGYLVVQNPSTATDAAMFRIGASVVVDKATPASASAPPPPVTVWGPVVPVPVSDPPPVLTVHAPEVLRVSSRTRVLRFVVYSNGEGKLKATLGGASLGTRTLRTGNNDVRFVLPQTVFASLKSGVAASNVLQLTSLSLQGTPGTTVTRHVAVQKPPRKPKKR